MSEFSAVAPPKSLSGSYDTNSAFADAVQRARQIAAKIHSGGTETGTKRPLEDGQTDGVPEVKKLATAQDNIALQIASMQAQRAAGAVANAITVEEWKVPDKMVGLIIGRGGEQITRLQAESGCKVQMAADSGGLPDRTCTLTGTRQAIEKAKELMMQIINRGGPPLPIIDANHVPEGHTIVEMSIPGPKVGLVIGKGGETIRSLQERAGVKMILIQDGPQQTATEKPLRITGEPEKCEFAKQLVMDLITEKELESLQKGGLDGTNEYGSSAGGSGSGSHEIMVPKQAVGVVIGKGGEMIKKIQQDSGAKVQFLNVKDESPEDKVCVVSGSPEQIQSASNFINDLIQSVLLRDQQNMGRGRGRGRGDMPGMAGLGRGRSDVPEVHYAVPANKCGIVIGKGGETVRNIIQQCGAYVTLSAAPPPNPQEKVFIIKGQPQQIEHAKELINEKIGCMGTVIQAPNPPQGQQPYPPQFGQQPQQPPQQPQQFQPPAPPQQFAAPQGWTNPYQPWQTPGAPATDPNAAAWAAYYSQYYSQQAVQPVQPVQPPQPGQPGATGAAVQPAVAPQHAMPSQPDQNPAQPQPPTAATAAPASAPGAAAPAATVTGQPDYSTAWAEYYRSLGMFREAEMIENQARAQAQMGSVMPGQPGQPFPQPAGGTTAPTSGGAPAPQPAPQPGAPPGPVPPTSVPAPVPPAASQPGPGVPAPGAAPAPVPTGVPAPGQPQPFPGGAPQAPAQWPAPGPYPQQFSQQQPNAFVGYNFPGYGQPPFSAAAPTAAAAAPQ